MKLRRLSKDSFARPKSVETGNPAPEADNGLLATTNIGDATVSIVDAAGKKALDCLWGELEDADDLFGRRRVAGITSKKSRRSALAIRSCSSRSGLTRALRNSK